MPVWAPKGREATAGAPCADDATDEDWCLAGDKGTDTPAEGATTGGRLAVAATKCRGLLRLSKALLSNCYSSDPLWQ